MSETVWTADPPAQRPAAAADGMAIVYHRPSGATHLLASPAPEILDALAEGPADAAGLVARLAAAHDLVGEDAQAAVAGRLAELEAAGLVRRA